MADSEAKVKIRLDPSAALAQLDQMEREAHGRVERARYDSAMPKPGERRSFDVSRGEAAHANQEQAGDPSRIPMLLGMQRVLSRVGALEAAARSPISGAMEAGLTAAKTGAKMTLYYLVFEALKEAVSKSANATDFLSRLLGNAGPMGDAGYNPLRWLIKKEQNMENIIVSTKRGEEEGREVAAAALRLGQPDRAVGLGVGMGVVAFKMAKDQSDLDVAMRQGVAGQVAGAIGDAVRQVAGAR